MPKEGERLYWEYKTATDCTDVLDFLETYP